MADTSCTIPAMKKKEPQRRRPSFTLYVRLEPKLGKALQEYMKATDPQPTRTAAVESLLREALERRGHWPPK